MRYDAGAAAMPRLAPHAPGAASRSCPEPALRYLDLCGTFTPAGVIPWHFEPAFPAAQKTGPHLELQEREPAIQLLSRGSPSFSRPTAVMQLAEEFRQPQGLVAPSGRGLGPIEPHGPRFSVRVAEHFLVPRHDDIQLPPAATEPRLAAQALELAGWQVVPLRESWPALATIRTDPALEAPLSAALLPVQRPVPAYQPALRLRSWEQAAPIQLIAASAPPRRVSEAQGSVSPAIPGAVARRSRWKPDRERTALSADFRRVQAPPKASPTHAAPAPESGVLEPGFLSHPIGPQAPQPMTIPVKVRPAPAPAVIEPVVETPPRPVREAPAAPGSGVRETLEKVQQQRKRPAYWHRLGEQAVVLWYERVKPALAGKNGQAALAGTAALILLWVALHGARSSPAVRSLLQPVRERSYFSLEESFQAGPGAWTNPAAWGRREDGLMEIREGLTLYQPSPNRADYELALTGQIRRGSINWVVRAVDSNNYYAFKLTHQGKGKDRRSVLLRWAVLDGSASEKVHVVTVPFDVEENRFYNMTVRASGDRITTVIESRGVDSYCDSRLKLGGVGFFAEPGESAVIQSLSVSGNDDPTGRAIFWLGGVYRSVSSKF